MGGYTPVFQSVFTGTLHGKWPDVGLWLCLLGMADKNGELDCTPDYIASVTGLAVSAVSECIDRFMRADPHSRSTEEGGRRLVLIDAARAWGWRIVNHGKYREKARKQAYDSQRTESGRDAERKRVSREVPRSPALSRSQTQTQTQTQTEEPEGSQARVSGGLNGANPRALGTNPRAVAEGLDSAAWKRWFMYRRDIRKPIKSASTLAAQQKLAAFGTEQAAVVEQSIANGWQGLFAIDDRGTAKKKSVQTWRPPPDEPDVQH